MNLQNAQSNDQMGECACCFDDVPLNRMISCNGTIAHSYCLQCPKRQIETQMGLSNCRPKCFGVNNCEGTFTRKDLQEVLSDQTFDRLEHMQQLEDLAAAGLDFLSECPFCDFKMECPPVEVDKEFRCQNKKCGKTSCRLCEKETHIPLSCKEADKDGQITLRHIVEEAMSAALIRQCNRCKHPFVKDHGCNKMTCSHCRNVQWSVDSCAIAQLNANKAPATCAPRTLPITSILVQMRKSVVPCTTTSRTATSKKSRRQLMKPWRKSERTIPICLMPT
jgi:TRIAD3 protein (E3 ubiquitin-protein ligase RNF216)